MCIFYAGHVIHYSKYMYSECKNNFEDGGIPVASLENGNLAVKSQIVLLSIFLSTKIVLQNYGVSNLLTVAAL